LIFLFFFSLTRPAKNGFHKSRFFFVADLTTETVNTYKSTTAKYGSMTSPKKSFINSFATRLTYAATERFTNTSKNPVIPTNIVFMKNAAIIKAKKVGLADRKDNIDSASKHGADNTVTPLKTIKNL